jgi:hypothetical protein
MWPKATAAGKKDVKILLKPRQGRHNYGGWAGSLCRDYRGSQADVPCPILWSQRVGKKLAWRFVAAVSNRRICSSSKPAVQRPPLQRDLSAPSGASNPMVPPTRVFANLWIICPDYLSGRDARLFAVSVGFSMEPHGLLYKDKSRGDFSVEVW